VFITVSSDKYSCSHQDVQKPKRYCHLANNKIGARKIVSEKLVPRKLVLRKISP
jgi:hypothetical protein